MRLHRVFVCALLAAGALVFVPRVRAGCVGPDDNIICTGTTPSTAFTPLGSDNITNNGNSGDLVNIPDGKGTITNNGTAGQLVNIPNGDGTITNNGASTDLTNIAIGDGTVTNNGTNGTVVNLSLGTATTNINGTVNGDVIHGGFGTNNQVTLGDGAVITGTIYNSGTNSTLAFSMTVDASAIDRLAAEIAQADPNGGTIIINGQTYTWDSFDQLKNLLKAATGQFLHYGDGRINDKDAMETMAAYCAADGGLILWAVDAHSLGTRILTLSKQQMSNALAKATSSGQHVLIAEAQGRQVWALKSGEYQLHDARGFVYDFIFAAHRCG